MSISGGEQAQVEPGQAVRAGREVLTADQRKYVELCEAGRVYEHLMEAVGLERRDVKIGFFTVFFGKEIPIGYVRGVMHDEVRARFAEVFAREFPGVVEVVRAVKRAMKTHAGLAWTLQNYESSLIINGVCRRLMNEHPAVPLCTIHDSVLTTRRHVELVRQTMLQEFARVGLGPQIHFEGEAIERLAA